MKGELFLYESAKRLCAFEGGALSSERCLVFIGGLTDGFLCNPYLEELAAMLGEKDVSFVQPLLSSSYIGFGTSSLKIDAQEIGLLLEHLRSKRMKREFILVGFSTGCNDIVYYSKTVSSDIRQMIKSAVLQAPISDRESLQYTMPETDELRQWAKKMIDQGKSEQIHDRLFWGSAITAYRLHSLTSKM